jgi:hypothetical protein
MHSQSHSVVHVARMWNKVISIEFQWGYILENIQFQDREKDFYSVTRSQKHSQLKFMCEGVRNNLSSLSTKNMGLITRIGPSTSEGCSDQSQNYLSACPYIVTARVPFINSAFGNKPPAHIHLNMSTAMFVEVMENPQHSTRLIPETPKLYIRVICLRNGWI